MTYNVAINGYGRIGRGILRAYYESDLKKTIQIKAINEISSIEEIAYLTKFDSIYGGFQGTIDYNSNYLQVNGEAIPIYSKREISHLPWKKLGIDLVLECTGRHVERKILEAHLYSGAKKVILSCPGGDDLDGTIVYGVNDNILTAKHKIISNASCTTNCVVPVIKTIDDGIGIDCGMITTMHSMMNDQPVTDSYNFCKDLRLTRSSSMSIVPVATELAKGIERILPHFAGRFQSASMRLPTMNVSAIDLTVFALKDTNLETVNNLFKDAATGSLSRVMGYTEEPMVSCDFIKDSRSAIIDGSQTHVGSSRMVRVLIWFDNEWGYVNRMLDTSLAMLDVAI